MFAGVAAAGVGIVYALVRFGTAVRLRRLRETLVRVQAEVRRSEQRLEALAGRLQVERSRRVSLQEKTQTCRERLEERYSRLRSELPPDLRHELRKCRARFPAPDPQAERILHDLKLADEIAATLASLSLLVVLLPADASVDESAGAALRAVLIRLLAERGARYHSPAADAVVCAFDQPDMALALAREFADQAPDEHLPHLRGALCTGLHYPPGKSEINQLLLRLLNHTMELARQAPPGLLLLNEHARQRVKDGTALVFYEPDHALQAFPWTRPTGVEAE